MLLRNDGAKEAHASTGLPIGVVEDTSFDEHTISLEPGDRMFLYSDGAFEELNDRREQFGQGRLELALADGRTAALPETLAGVVREIKSWTATDDFRDDISLVAAEIVGSAPS